MCTKKLGEGICNNVKVIDLGYKKKKIEERFRNEKVFMLY